MGGFMCETQSESGAAIWQAVSMGILIAGESVNTCAEKCLAHSARKCVFKASGEGRRRRVRSLFRGRIWDLGLRGADWRKQTSGCRDSSLVGGNDECMSNEHDLQRDKRSQSVVPQYQRRRLSYKQIEPSTLLGTVLCCLSTYIPFITTRLSVF